MAVLPLRWVPSRPRLGRTHGHHRLGGCLPKALSSSSPVEILLHLGQNFGSKWGFGLKSWAESRVGDRGSEGCDPRSPQCSLGLNLGWFQTLS